MGSRGYRDVKYIEPRGTTIEETIRKGQPLFQEIGVTGKNRKTQRWQVTVGTRE